MILSDVELVERGTHLGYSVKQGYKRPHCVDARPQERVALSLPFSSMLSFTFHEMTSEGVPSPPSPMQVGRNSIYLILWYVALIRSAPSFQQRVCPSCACSYSIYAKCLSAASPSPFMVGGRGLFCPANGHTRSPGGTLFLSAQAQSCAS